MRSSFLSPFDSLSFSAQEITNNENDRSLIYNHRIQVIFANALCYFRENYRIFYFELLLVGGRYNDRKLWIGCGQNGAFSHRYHK